jgi:hypothetical protein
MNMIIRWLDAEEARRLITPRPIETLTERPLPRPCGGTDFRMPCPVCGGYPPPCPLGEEPE